MRAGDINERLRLRTAEKFLDEEHLTVLVGLGPHSESTLSLTWLTSENC